MSINGLLRNSNRVVVIQLTNLR